MGFIGSSYAICFHLISVMICRLRMDIAQYKTTGLYCLNEQEKLLQQSPLLSLVNANRILH